MKKGENCWYPVYEEFARLYPELDKQMVDWYPSDQMEIVVKIRDGKKYVYDWMRKSAKVLLESKILDNTEEEWRKRFSKNLNRKLYNVSKSQDLLAFETGISTVTISKYINGRATPSAYNLEKIASALNCSVSELIH